MKPTGTEIPREKVYRSLRQRVAWVQHLAKVGLRVSKERPRVQALGRHIAPGSLILDVGAHLGYLTKEFARLHEGSCSVIAFEPIAYTHSILSIVCGLRRNVLVEKISLTDFDGIAEMRIPIKDGGTLGIGLSHASTGHAQAQGRDYVVEWVTACLLDDYMANCSQARVGFIKADIEGGELRMLQGAKRVLVEHRPVIYLEVDKCDPRPFLSSFGYQAFGMSDEGTLRAPWAGDHDLLFKPMEAL